MFGRLTVRKFQSADLDAILDIEHASFGADAYDRNLFAEFARTCGDLFLVVERRSKVCGYVVTCIRGERAELVSIAVVPAGRRRGAASALLTATLRRLRRRPVDRCGLMVRVSNAAARGFYEKFGFRKVRTVRGYYEDGEDGLLMTKSLS
ncbi:MAG TPA: ribosomal protein S18-alanine N-acetyltransferase [Bryobacteraceae bacterium]|nr:ribosomal protein S18-alanine N-acetyltransferase [Bryobacteraceae bacterium]